MMNFSTGTVPASSVFAADNQNISGDAIEELMALAKGAGASKIDWQTFLNCNVLHVCWDGEPIDSLQSLLDVMQVPGRNRKSSCFHPFANGFLTILQSCKHVTLVSQEGRFSSNTDFLLSGRSIDVRQNGDWDGLTSITMVAVGFDLANIKLRLKQLTNLYRTAVFLDGHLLELADCKWLP